MENAAPAVDPVAAPQGQPAAPAAETPQPGTQENQNTNTPVGNGVPAPSAAPSADSAAQPQPQNWADNWRQLMADGIGAGTDEKLMKRLDRFQSPADILKFALNAEKKISSGEYKRALGKDASPEEIAAWKAENGVPEKASDYLADMQGLIIGEEDQDGINFILDRAVKASIPKQYAQEFIKGYDEWKEQSQQMIAEEDSRFARDAEDQLRKEWGGEFRMNQNAVKSFAINAFGEELASEIFNARLPDGSLFGNNPALNMAFASLARELNPAATVVPGAGANSMQAIESELAQIRKFVRTNRDEYFKDSAMQKRYHDLTEAKEKMK